MFKYFFLDEKKKMFFFLKIILFNFFNLIRKNLKKPNILIKLDEK